MIYALATIALSLLWCAAMWAMSDPEDQWEYRLRRRK
jgi:hypothetical protein